ncbi:MAG TPA: alpha/beta hydrolase [Allocoleopsis sp.]
MSITSPDFILYAQHGWANNNRQILQMCQGLASENTLIIAPNLGWLNTWISINPLVNKVANLAQSNFNKFPDVPVRIIAHSMGGLIWLEVLNKYPQWWDKIHSLILITSPIGGSDIARIIDPLSIGIGAAKDLGVNRRLIAEKIAQSIPTLIIASDIDGGSDGMITLESMKFDHAHYICLSGIRHAQMKNHPQVADTIRNFWNIPPTTNIKFNNGFLHTIIKKIQAVTGITDGHYRDFYRSKIYINLIDGSKIHIWQNPFLLNHVFVSDPQGNCIYSGFVGWLHNQDLQQTLTEIKLNFSAEYMS